MHLDSPWGGGKTTFANFVTAILTQGDDDGKKAEIAKDLGTYVRPGDWPKATQPPAGLIARLRRLVVGRADDRWIAASFNAWQNEHVVPYWWNFYIEVRKQLLAPYWWPRRVWYWVTERGWRIASRDIVPQALSLLLLVSAVYLLYRLVSAETLLAWLQRDATATPGQANAGAGQGLLALFLLTVAGGSGLKLLGSFRSGTEWVIRAAGDGGDSQVLGRGDPLHGFSAHFRGFCAALDRPIVVVIDDLDRCQPAYVVELIRGLMTVFNSPRIVYLILGDRRWIETCFAKAYAAMAEAEAKPASFGSRFAEKSTQLSFLLPSVPEARVAAYVDALLLGREVGTDPRAERAVAEAVAGIVGQWSQTGARYRGPGGAAEGGGCNSGRGHARRREAGRPRGRGNRSRPLAGGGRRDRPLPAGPPWPDAEQSPADRADRRI